MNINKEKEESEILPSTNKIDPTEFDVTISALLIGLGAEKYINVFRKNNIGQSTLIELTDEDLTKLGVDDFGIRRKILEEVKNLPIYEDAKDLTSAPGSNLTPIDIVEILEESSQHLYRIYLSVLANTLAVKKTKKIANCLLHRDKYASDIALATLSEMTKILNTMELSIHTQMKSLTGEAKPRNNKVIVGSVGSAAIAVLAALFVRSLVQLRK